MFALIWIFACETPAPAPPVEPVTVVAPPAGPTLYALPMPLEDQRGAALGLDAWRGQPVLVSMFYSSCRSACPILIRKLQALEGELAPEVRDELRVLLVSLDPAHDTPDALAGLAAMHQTDAARWTLARTAPGDERTLAAALGIRYTPTSDGGFSHTSPIVLLDREGHIAARLEQLGDDPTTLLATATQLALR